MDAFEIDSQLRRDVSELLKLIRPGGHDSSGQHSTGKGLPQTAFFPWRNVDNLFEL